MKVLPEHLAKKIQHGKVMLLLGAGASVGCSNRLGESPPLGGRLTEILADSCGMQMDPGDELQTVAGNAREILGDMQFFELLRKYYLHCTPSDSLKRLSRYYFSRIYTLNIDDALEAAFRETGVQTADVFVGNSPIISRDGSPSVQIVKLNGSVDRPENGLIFSREEFNHGMVRGVTWYDEIVRDYYSSPFVIVGTELQEPIFWHHVTRFMRDTGLRAGYSYIICPTFSPHRRKQLERNGIQPIEGTLTDLVACLADGIGPRISFRDICKNRNPVLFSHMRSERVKAALADSPFEITALTVVDRGLLEELVPKDLGAVRGFYLGKPPSWRDVLDGVPAEILDAEKVRKTVESGARLILVEGSAGTGKTSCAMIAAMKIADSGQATVLWVDASIGLPSEAVSSFLAEGGRVVVFVDSFAGRERDLGKVFESAGRDVSLVLIDRTTRVRRSSYRSALRGDVVNLRINRIEPGDVPSILEKVEMFGPWSYLSRLSTRERRDLLLQKAEKVLLVALREATSGKGYDDILTSEFGEMGEDAKNVCLFVSLASMHSLGVSRKTLVSALDAYYHPKALPEPEQFVVDGVLYRDQGGLYRVRHAMIAEYNFTRLAQPDVALGVLRSLLLSLSRFGSPIRKYAGRGDVRLYTAISNHEFLWATFRRQRESVVALLGACERWFSGDALFWLQYALFEQKCGRLRDAVDHIRIALSIYPSSFQITNAYANIHFSAAEGALSASDGLAIMEDASAMMQSQMKDPDTEPYAVVGLCKGRLRAIMKWVPEKGRREKQDLLGMLKDAQHKYPQNREIREAQKDLEYIYARHYVKPVSSRHRGRKRKGRRSN